MGRSTSATTRGTGTPAWAEQDYCYLTTTGRRSGQPHRIEIWFVVETGLVFVLAGGGESADWVGNLRADPRVTLEVGAETAAGRAWVAADPGAAGGRLVPAVRRAMTAKYQHTQPSDPLDSWAANALPVAIDVTPELTMQRRSRP